MTGRRHLRILPHRKILSSYSLKAGVTVSPGGGSAGGRDASARGRAGVRRLAREVFRWVRGPSSNAGQACFARVTPSGAGCGGLRARLLRAGRPKGRRPGAGGSPPVPSGDDPALPTTGRRPPGCGGDPEFTRPSLSCGRPRPRRKPWRTAASSLAPASAGHRAQGEARQSAAHPALLVEPKQHPYQTPHSGRRSEQRAPRQHALPH
ncbi:hypothetical protein SSCG_01190 [Streptomyces clavuligerus]|nr:hypothetical protein SSCG_01190 [Streptomyces clavuligerus]